MAKQRTITLTDRAPVKIDEEAWPLIASAEWHDGQVRCQANHEYTIRVREHADGRRIVYGIYDTTWQGGQGRRAGYLLPDADMAATVRAIEEVSERIGDAHGVADACIADLPAEELA